MRLVGRPINIDRQGQGTETVSSVKSSLKVGGRFSAVIVSVDGENVQLQVNGKLINARNAGSEHLFSGSNAQFEVLKSEGERIEIRPIALSGLSSPERDFIFLKANLNKLGIGFSSDNAEILAKMMKAGSPISSGTFMEAKRDFISVQKLADALFFQEIGGEARTPEPAEPGTSKLSDTLSSKDLLHLIFTGSREVISDKASLASLKDFVWNQLNEDGGEKEPVLNGRKQAVKEGSLEGLKQGENQEEKQSQAINSQRANDLRIKSGKEKTGTDFVKGLIDGFKTLSSNRETLMNQVVFLNKLGVKPSIFNLSLSEGFLNGKPGFSKGAAELLRSVSEHSELFNDKGLGDKIKTFIKGSLDLARLADGVDAKSLEERAGNFKLLNHELSKMNLGDSSSKSFEQLSLFKENANLIKDMQPVWNTFFIPVLNKGRIDDIEMYVKRDKSGALKKKNSEDRVIYLSLKTDNIERVKTRIDYSKKDLKLIFVLENEELREYVKTRVPELTDRLSTMIKKKVQISVNTDSFDSNLIEFDFVASFQPSSNIDMRI